jgi:hypothetical protein
MNEQQNQNSADVGRSELSGLVRPGDIHSMEMLDCPVFLLQQWQEEWNDNDELVEYWETTEGVWFTRTEAEAWAQAHHYRMGKWRVYSIGARGELKTLLKAHTDYSA